MPSCRGRWRTQLRIRIPTKHIYTYKYVLYIVVYAYIHNNNLRTLETSPTLAPGFQNWAQATGPSPNPIVWSYYILCWLYGLIISVRNRFSLRCLWDVWNIFDIWTILIVSKNCIVVDCFVWPSGSQEIHELMCGSSNVLMFFSSPKILDSFSLSLSLSHSLSILYYIYTLHILVHLRNHQVLRPSAT